MMKTESKADRSAVELTEMEKAVELGLAAAKKMSRNLHAEHKRWNMPLLTWKNGKVVQVKP
jgi:hypothetical protein